jgi:hypothetical protein
MTRKATKPIPNRAEPSTPVQDFRDLDDAGWAAMFAELRAAPPFDFGNLPESDLELLCAPWRPATP